MARAAGDAGDGDEGVAVADRDAVVSGPDLGAGDGHPRVALQVDAVGVGAGGRGGDGDAAPLEVVAAQQRHVEELAVERGDVLHDRVVGVHELHRLRTRHEHQEESWERTSASIDGDNMHGQRDGSITVGKTLQFFSLGHLL